MADGFTNSPEDKLKSGLNWPMVVAVLIVADLIFLNYFVLSEKFLGKKQTQPTQTKPASPSAEVTKVFLASPSAGCDAQCQKIIEEKLAELKNELATQNKSDSQPTSSEFTGERTVYFGASGSTTSTEWVDVPDTTITFNSTNYPGAKQFKFVATLRSDAPDRKAFARIYNLSNKIEIWQSDISYAGLTNKTVESASFTLPSGNLSLKVQFKSFLLNTSYIENPQLKIIY